MLQPPVLVRAVAGFYERTARRAGVPRARGGAVAFVQRFDSALRLNVHFHVLWLDGVYGWEPGRGEPVFGYSVLVCPQCAGPRRVLAAIHDPAAIARVLGALGLSGEESGPVGCRAPPGGEGGGPDGESGWLE